MADDTDMAAELVGEAYKARKGSVQRGAGSGVEVRVRTVRRRSWSAEDKLRIVNETLARWPRWWRTVVPEPSPAAAVAPFKAEVAPGLLEVAFPSGATVRIKGAADPAMLRVVLAELGGR